MEVYLNMPKIEIDDRELLVIATKVVDTNGVISIGREHAGKLVRAYVVSMEV